MKATKTIATIALIGAALTAPVAHAQESVLQNILSRMLDSAVELTIDELQHQATETVANASHALTEKASDVQTKVTVTEFAAKDATTNEQSKSE
ncbi:hypothetical protein QTP81_12615 [Alteromonas sp. ASW11-36]|uniref:Secreted protein n=1 Tax=Alteromonas arenosi TaxID=3055817 RepID=A0ABT7SZ43_9ALTE|nr:hypothetical protein [Alteromonas sp. ASW11-36]MDM7861436.1 hypothetical protein [Alteromonas sp. ASW11-36]